MACDPKKIFTDLEVIGAVLSYSNLWVAGTKKVNYVDSEQTLRTIFNFEYKGRNYFNFFTYDSSNVLQTAEIHTGTYPTDSETDPVTDATLVERISYV